jgi:hypothetical protein
MVGNPRYYRKPLVLLLEFYVLRAIGELPQDKEDVMNAMAPRLQDLFGGGGRWHDALEAAVHMEADTQEKLRGMWARNLEVARANGEKLTAQQFAERVVDESFPLDPP